MKRKISILIATIMVFMTVCGFGMNVSADTRIVIKFAAQDDSTPATQILIDEFNKSQNKYTVEWVKMTNDSGQMHDQLITSL